MFEFLFPWLFLLIPLPWLLRFVAPQRQQANLTLRIPGFARLGLARAISEGGKSSIHPIWILVWLCLVSGAAHPVWLDDPVSLPSEGRDIMLAVDLSASMAEEDMEYQGRFVDRLSMVKAVVSDFIEQRQGDRLGLILFGDTAFLQTPLTRDVKTVSAMLSEAQLGLVGRATAIGDALGLAVKRFNEKENSNRIVVLLTDGQNTAGNLQPDEALLLAKEAKSKVYTIGVGADVQARGLFGMQSPLDETLLQQLAKQTGGLYFRARDVKGLAQIYQELDKLEPIARDTETFRPQTALFYLPLLAALALIALRALIVRGQVAVRSNP